MAGWNKIRWLSKKMVPKERRPTSKLRRESNCRLWRDQSDGRRSKRSTLSRPPAGGSRLAGGLPNRPATYAQTQLLSAQLV
eukprot:750644-Hanusia_phi.AAC.1